MALKTAVIGIGTVSPVHLSGVSRNPRSELVAVCDVDEERARSAASRYNAAPYTDVDELLGRGDLDWVHVCTPVQTHLDLAIRAIEAGVPVLIEKPVADTLDEVDRLARAAERHGVRVAVVHNLLHTPAVRRARAAIRDGDLGTVRGIDLVYTDMTRPDEANRGSWVFDMPGGEFEEGLPHPIYTTLGVAGFPASADDICATTGLRGEYDHDFKFDEAGFQYVTADGAICSATMRAGTVPQRFFTVHGDRASLVVDLLTQTVIELDGDYTGSALGRARANVDHAVGRVAGTLRSGAMMARRQLSDDWETEKALNSHYRLFDTEIDALLGEAQVSGGLERARWTMTVMEAIREAPKGRVTPTVN
jgi:predicted dehydrogenase